VLWRVCEDGKGWRAAALLVAALVLSHILTTIVLVLGATGLLLRRPLAAALASFRRLALVLGVAFCLTAFWALPFMPARALHRATSAGTSSSSTACCCPTRSGPISS
jgi:uncharacterized membrane protein